jgi:hypothetical protein
LFGHPDHVIFQSWHRQPKHLLPETDSVSFTGLINRYFKNGLTNDPGRQHWWRIFRRLVPWKKRRDAPSVRPGASK